MKKMKAAEAKKLAEQRQKVHTHTHTHTAHTLHTHARILYTHTHYTLYMYYTHTLYTHYRITGNVCVAKFLSFKFLRDLIFAQTEHAQYKMHVL